MIEPLDRLGSVRRALPADEGRIYDLLVALHRENKAGWGYPYRPEIVLSRIEAGTRPVPATRTNPQNQVRGIIGVIDGPDGKLAGSIGIFLDQAMWFTDFVACIELWVYVRPEHRKSSYEAELRKYGREIHNRLRPDPRTYPAPFELFTGFQHRGNRFAAMLRLWRRWGGKMCGALFVVE